MIIHVLIVNIILFQTPVTYDMIKMRGQASPNRQYIAVLHYGEETYRGEGANEMYAKYRAAHMAIKALDRSGMNSLHLH